MKGKGPSSKEHAVVIMSSTEGQYKMGAAWPQIWQKDLGVNSGTQSMYSPEQ